MPDVVNGFALLGVVVGVGYLLGRVQFLGEAAEFSLSRLTFVVTGPALLFTTLYDADLSAVFSSAALVPMITATVVTLLYVLLAGLVLRRPGAEVVVGALSAGYVNAHNLGIPLLVLVVGSAAMVAPIMLFQVLVILPASFIALDMLTGRSASRWRALLIPVRNPYVIAVALGFLVALLGWQPPPVIIGPIEMLGGAAVPMMLLVFGISLHGAPMPGSGPGRAAMWLAVGLKSVAAPAIAYVMATALFDLDTPAVLTATVVAALPTAQNIFIHAVRYQTSTRLAREAILLTTLISLPVILLVATALT